MKNGLVNLEIIGRSSKAVGTFSFGAIVHGKALTPAAASGKGNTGPVAANIHMMTLPKSAGPAVPHPGNPCVGMRKVRQLGKKFVDIGGLYSIGMPHAQMAMTYSESATTTVGFDAEVPLTNGSFSAAGSFTVTKTGAETFPTQPGAEENMQTAYTFGEYFTCGMDLVLPEVWVTGQHTVTVLAPGATKCSVHFQAGGTFSTTNERAGTFMAGVDLMKEIGVNLTAQSGYDKSVGITWTFPHGGGFLCGTNNFPSKAAWNVMDVSSSGNPPPDERGHPEVKGQRSSR